MGMTISDINVSGLLRLNEVMQELKDIGDCYEIDYSGITDKPIGEKQKSEASWEYEYILQSCGVAGDDYFGHMYIPVGNGKHYFDFFYRA